MTVFLTTIPCAPTWAQETTSDTSEPAQPKNPVELQREQAKKYGVKDPNSHLFGFHGTLAIPHPTSLGLDYHLNSSFSFSASIGSFRNRIEHTDIGIFNTEITARWHIMNGAFFIGSHFGKQKMTGERTQQIQTETVTAKAEYEGTYYTPHIGWLFVDGPGFTMGAEFGFMTPVGSDITISSNASAGVQATGDYAELVRSTRRLINDTIDHGFPHIAVLRLGWVF
ncbi:hypothetical protein [Pseudobdellovibrio exovorus]|uniref:Outer membrane protein beta-barrel domain-containing protein n=1 Tax=Pseudobdellovibrio exovorus JSS TaxID=1184267 RepID=M4VDP6_9BACT|nr:hypothetical protein [Pseudobdellovibrio exovorus]AGH96610.1 hypothetical protein A11Q_2394 [Pseudobdellovibrio exovorus JSS]